MLEQCFDVQLPPSARRVVQRRNSRTVKHLRPRAIHTLSAPCSACARAARRGQRASVAYVDVCASVEKMLEHFLLAPIIKPLE